MIRPGTKVTHGPVTAVPRLPVDPGITLDHLKIIINEGGVHNMVFNRGECFADGTAGGGWFVGTALRSGLYLVSIWYWVGDGYQNRGALQFEIITGAGGLLFIETGTANPTVEEHIGASTVFPMDVGDQWELNETGSTDSIQGGGLSIVRVGDALPTG